MFTIYKDKAGLFRWNLISANNKIIANGESYVDKQDAIDCINIIRQLAPRALIRDNS